MSKTQLARGIWTDFPPTEDPFATPDGMVANLRLIDDHLALYTLAGPVVATTALPTDARQGAGQIFTDGTYAVLNAGVWQLYPSRMGMRAIELANKTEHINIGSAWQVNTQKNEKSYLTLATMQADTAQPAGSQGVVTNDPGHSAETPINGVYTWTGALWARNAFQPANQGDVDSLRENVTDFREQVQGLIRSGERRALNVLDDHGFLLLYFSIFGGMHTPIYALDQGAGGDGFRVLDKHGFVGLDSNRLLQRMSALEQRPSPVNAYPKYGGQLGQLKAALCDPFMQFLGVVYAGDSITWGESASGNSISTPRAHALTDARNNITAPTWANILTKHMGRNYFGKADPDSATGWPGSPSGECQFSYTKQFRVMPRANERIGAWAVAVNSAAALKQTLSTSTAAASDGGSIRFGFTGTAFSVMHQVRADGAPFEVFVDGVSKGVLQTSTAGLGIAAQYGYVQAVDLGGFKRGALIELRAKAGAVAVLALEAIQVDRVLRVTNQGLIGTDSREWANSLFAASVRADDSFTLIQIGTNDRVGSSSSVGTLQSNLEALVSQARIRNIAPILMCANATTDASAGLNATQRAAILEAARTLGVDFIDQQPVTQIAIDRGDAVLADGLHPVNLGHSLMGGNAVNQLEGSHVY